MHPIVRYCQVCRSAAYRERKKAYMHAYFQRPEVKEKKRESNHTEWYRAWRRAREAVYGERYKQRRNALRRTPEYLAKALKRKKRYLSTEKGKAKAAAYYKAYVESGRNAEQKRKRVARKRAEAKGE